MSNTHKEAQENYTRAKDRLFALECDDSIHSENHPWWTEVKQARLEVQRCAAIVEQWRTNETSGL
tara:strand:- start:29887 stop:30081 length:195 start_codon:yes stop_codon:yes gene_type:complete